MKSNNIEKAITYDNTRSALKEMAAASRSEYEELLSPVFSREQLKELDLDQLKDLLDEVIDRKYQINMKRGGIIKDPRFNVYKDGGGVKPISFLELQSQIEAMSDEEKENLNFMLNALLNKPKDKK
jgi:hypothetical protein